jgi:dipeptidyl-peptidase-3
MSLTASFKHEKLYALHLPLAAWHGSKIILRQTSHEAENFFDFIMRLHKSCGGDWAKLIDKFMTKENLTGALQ